MVELTVGNFDAEVTDRPGKVVVDFWGKGCGPCRMMEPVLERLERSMPEVAFARMCVTDYPNVAWAFDVVSVPSFVLFKDGAPVDQLVGAVPAARMRGFIESH